MNKKPTIICISGKARSGKGEFARMFIDVTKSMSPLLKCKEIAYGDYLKFVCGKYFDWNGEKDEVGRHILQYIGTDVARENNPDIWVNVTIELTKGLLVDCDYILISDCRFQNECERWREEGYEVITVRVERIGFESQLTDEQKKHPSETALDDYGFDYIVENGGTLADFYGTVEYLVESWIK